MSGTPAVGSTSAVTPDEATLQRRSALFSKIGVTAPVSAHVPVERGRTFRDVGDALAEFNSHFCYIHGSNAIVRLRDRETFKPEMFVKFQYNNWRFPDPDNPNKTKTAAPVW